MAIVKFENLSHIAGRNENHTEIVPQNGAVVKYSLSERRRRRRENTNGDIPPRGQSLPQQTKVRSISFCQSSWLCCWYVCCVRAPCKWPNASLCTYWHVTCASSTHCGQKHFCAERNFYSHNSPFFARLAFGKQQNIEQNDKLMSWNSWNSLVLTCFFEFSRTCERGRELFKSVDAAFVAVFLVLLRWPLYALPGLSRTNLM